MAKAQASVASNTRVPVQSVVLYRDGKQVVPPIGQPFDFTAQELSDIEAVNPDAVTAMAVVDLSVQQQEASL